MDRCSNRGTKSQRRERRQKIREEKRIIRKKEQGVRKGRKAAKHCALMFWGSGGSKSKLAKAEPSGEMRDQKLHAVMA